mmetsp:Transcript_35667/g.81364  ORF Transcript_35667/g.81364 Transcript_35667/m.81364 type:complete len:304 (-) Transcript_35667:520-1431(-)
MSHPNLEDVADGTKTVLLLRSPETDLHGRARAFVGPHVVHQWAQREAKVTAGCGLQRSHRPSRPVDARDTNGSVRPRQPLWPWRPSWPRRPRVAKVANHSLGAGCTVSPCGTRRSRHSRLALEAGCTDSTGGALGSHCTRRSKGSSKASWTRKTTGAGRTRPAHRTLRSSRAGDAWRAWRAHPPHCSLDSGQASRPLGSRSALGPLRAHGADGTLEALRAGGARRAGRPRGARWTGGSQNTGQTLGTLGTHWPGRADWPLERVETRMEGVDLGAGGGHLVGSLVVRLFSCSNSRRDGRASRRG